MVLAMKGVERPLGGVPFRRIVLVGGFSLGLEKEGEESKMSRDAGKRDPRYPHHVGERSTSEERLCVGKWLL
jgi:hypothetical protein